MQPPADLPRILKLPPALADQIAAGEVVERPASIVKELVENSLDSGADSIHIQVDRGGIEYIRVTDNGQGIHPQDLELALHRHATSKIRSLEDLAAINTLGFRGEALPSIASVAAFKLVSRTEGQETAYLIGAEAGKVHEAPRPAAHPPGTTVEVSRLFHGIPARRKFLRSERTEYLHVLETVRRMALSRDDVVIRLVHNGKTVLHSPAARPPAPGRIAGLLGRSFIEHSMEVAAANGHMRLRGWLGGAKLCRSQSDQQHFYLNARMVRDRRLTHAVRMAYAEHVPPGRFPAYLLYLEIDPASVDVNVHPTKHEVRFQRARDVHDFITSAIRRVLDGAAAGTPASSPGIRGHFPAGMIREPVAETPDAGEFPRLGRPLVCLEGRYIIAEREGALLLIDALAAARRRLEHLIPAERAAGGLRIRPLLVPVELDATAAQIDRLDDTHELLESLGLDLAVVGPGRVRVRGIPVLLEDADLLRLVRDVLAAVAGEEGSLPGSGLEAVLTAHADSGLRHATPATMTAALRSLEELDLDLFAGCNPGLWRTLGARDIADLVKGRG